MAPLDPLIYLSCNFLSLMVATQDCGVIDVKNEVFSASPSLKTRFATLNFKGAAASWLQMVEHRGRITDWDDFCSAVFERYDQDQYQLHLR